MGVCFSKKKESASAPSTPSVEPNILLPNEKGRKKKITDKEETKKGVKSPKQPSAAAAPASAPVEKQAVFVITQNTKKTASNSTTTSEEEKEKPRKSDPHPELNINNIAGCYAFIGLPEAEEARAGPVRTSSCTKEEVDAILIQCGRLSRSSSDKALNDTSGGHRKYSGSKRSYDFDNEKSNRDEEEVWDQKQLSRPSPRRRTPNRERSGSRERGSHRGVSRSPGRRSEGPAGSSSAVCEQPAKMVSVPAREKGVPNYTAAENAGVRRASTAVSNRRNASPRSRSPANTSRVSNENAALHQLALPQPLSRSSSRKAEQSPHRRSPMTEIDENSLKGHQSSNTNKAQKSREGEEGVKKTNQIQTEKNGTKSSINSNCVRDHLMSCRAKEKQPEPEIVEEAKDSKGGSKDIEVGILSHRTVTRTRSSRRSSRDLDHILSLNPDTNNPNAATYTSLLLEDAQNYHQQNAGFSLPACVSKACSSILEAVADLKSSSDQSNNENGQFFVRRDLTPEEPFVESEMVVKDDLMKPSLHKYISVRDLGGDMEPQESAGSNSFVGQPWSSTWEFNSVDSTDRYCTSQSKHREEVEEESSLSGAVRDFDARGTRLRSGGSNSSSLPSATRSSSKKRA